MLSSNLPPSRYKPELRGGLTIHPNINFSASTERLAVRFEEEEEVFHIKVERMSPTTWSALMTWVATPQMKSSLGNMTPYSGFSLWSDIPCSVSSEYLIRLSKC